MRLMHNTSVSIRWRRAERPYALRRPCPMRQWSKQPILIGAIEEQVERIGLDDIRYPRVFTTRSTIVSLPCPAVAVICQQPTVGNSSALGWKPLLPYPNGTDARSAGAGPSRRLP